MPKCLPVIVVVVAIGVAFAGDLPPIPKDILPAELSFEVPLGLGARPETKNNPLSAARVRLGRQLFFDPILSANRTIACASCHDPAHGFASPDGRPRGIRGEPIARRAPTLFNRAFGTAFFWDGRAASLEEQALKPIVDPNEMGADLDEVLQRLREHPHYREAFQAAFDDGVTAGNLGKAIASFERVLVRGGSRVDRFRQKGEHEALTPEERHGLWLFESKAQCWRCHTGSNFTDEAFHNTGVSWGHEPLDLGRYAVTKAEADRGKFKTPTLRCVSLTAPYMHDGSLKTLEEVLEFYSKGGGENPSRDPKMTALNLSPEEIRSLVAFLKAL